MAHFCLKTGVRIAGPGIVDTYELTAADQLDSGMKGIAKHPEVIEVDGVEEPLKKAKAAKPQKPAPATPSASAPEGDKPKSEPETKPDAAKGDGKGDKPTNQ